MIGHGTITGATGTGKTVTAQVLIEEFSRAGVPVVAFDCKGDLAGLARVSTDAPSPCRSETLPVKYWDPQGVRGNLLRVAVGYAGPRFIANMLGLAIPERRVVSRVMNAWSDASIELLDLADVHEAMSMARSMASAREDGATVAAIDAVQRVTARVLTARSERVFGGPLALPRCAQVADKAGRGVIHLISARDLADTPPLYAAFSTWLLAELLRPLPLVAENGAPSLAVFIDAAELLFSRASRVEHDAIARLLSVARGKGVCTVLVLHDPLTIPECVQALIAFRIQHARYPGPDQAAFSTYARRYVGSDEQFNPDTVGGLTIGEALVAFEARDRSRSTDRVIIRRPDSEMSSDFVDVAAATEVPVVARAAHPRRQRAARRR